MQYKHRICFETFLVARCLRLLDIDQMKLCMGTFFSVLLCGGALASDQVQNLRVVWSERPQAEAIVVWDSNIPYTEAKLGYSTVSRNDSNGDYSFHEPVCTTGLYADGAEKGIDDKSTSPELFYHHVKLRNLSPGTTYFLAVDVGDEMGREYHFKTAPDDDQPIKIIYAGDSRSKHEVSRSINRQIREMIRTDESIIALLHGGDYAGTTTRELWKIWLESYALTTTKTGKLLPIIPVIGNHDVVEKRPIFRHAYGYPGGENDYYTCRLTPSVGLLCLNSEISAEGDQKKFLRASLTELNADGVKWQIAAYHRPAYPAVKQPSVAKVSWVPLFDEFKLDLVLESDGHCIKRTVPIRNDKEDPDGVIYLGEGGYGAPQRDPQVDRWYLQGEGAFAGRGDHIVILEITSEEIHYSALLNSGETADSAVFKPRR